MSHFSVLVITNDPTEEAVSAALAPFHEFECTGTDDQYVVDVDETEELRAEFDAESDKSGSFSGWLSENYGRALLKDGETRGEQHKYGFAVVGADGDVTKVIRRTNPNKHWDWWVIGGRWREAFTLKNGTDRFDVSELSTFDRIDASQGKPIVYNSRKADMAYKRDIDIDAMRAESAAEAAKRYDEYMAVAGETPEITPWSEFIRRVDATGLSVDDARIQYRSQPRVAAFSDSEHREKFGLFISHEDYMTTPTTHQNATTPKTCGHPLPDGPEITDRMCAVCETCKLHMCDDCEVLSGLCSSCAGDICENCKVNARQRQKIEDNRSVTEYLCKGCAEKQDAARLALIKSVRENVTGDDTDPDDPPRYDFGNPSVRWLSDVISDLGQAISEAKEAL